MKSKSNPTPGSTLKKDFLTPMDISVESLAMFTKIPEKVLENIVEGDGVISKKVAAKLSKFFGNSQGFWLDLQDNYDEKA